MIRTRMQRYAAVMGAVLLCVAAHIDVHAAAPAPAFLAGGDVSVLTLAESKNAAYYDRAGQRKDAITILGAAGFNIARLRLYDRPGPGNGNEGWYWPAGSQDLADVLSLARRSKAAGMQIELTLHYSDFWTNGGLQNTPVAWQGELAQISDPATRFVRVRQLVYQHTYDVMTAMKRQGTMPQFVSLGNEIAGGIVFPYGELYPNGQLSPDGWQRLGALLKEGYAAVKAVSPETKVIVHLDDAGNSGKYNYFFDNLKAQGVKYDVIGASYYPYWTRKKVAAIVPFIKELTARYDKDVMIMEAGFNWNPTLPGNWTGQLADNGPYPAAWSSPAGQKAFMDELVAAMRTTPRVLGVLYWDPIMIQQPDLGWAYSDVWRVAGANVVANTTLFDFDGKALPILDGWKNYTSARLAGDADGDGAVTCLDLGLAKASMGKRAGQPGFDSRADINGDGVVDLRDMTLMAKALPSGSSCVTGLTVSR